MFFLEIWGHVLVTCPLISVYIFTDKRPVGRVSVPHFFTLCGLEWLSKEISETVNELHLVILRRSRRISYDIMMIDASLRSA